MFVSQEFEVTDLIWQAGLALDVINAMCSAKNDEMQNEMRLNPSTVSDSEPVSCLNYHFKGIHFVRNTAILLCKLADSGVHSSLIECKTKAIQVSLENLLTHIYIYFIGTD